MKKILVLSMKKAKEYLFDIHGDENIAAIVNFADKPGPIFESNRYTQFIPYYWFPIFEMGEWGYSPFYGALKVYNNHKHDEGHIIFHCEAGVNRSACVAMAVLMAQGLNEEQAILMSSGRDSTKLMFGHNLERGNIPEDIHRVLNTACVMPDASLYRLLSHTKGFRNLIIRKDKKLQ